MNQDIEVLRAVAIVFVVLHHFGFLIVGGTAFRFYLQHFSLGSGVDLFFCISGFVITNSYYAQFANAERKHLFALTAAFWLRRAYRLWPSAWLWLVVMVVLYSAFGLAGLWDNLTDAIAAMFEVANFHWWWCLGGHGTCGYIGQYWSLSLEEQFYMLFPLLFLLPRRSHVWVLLAIAAAQLAIPRWPWSHDLLWFTRTDAIALGACLYLFSASDAYRLIKPVFLDHRLVALVTGAGLLAALAIFNPPEGFPDRAVVPFATGMVTLVCAVLVFVASYDADWLGQVPLLRPVLLWIGARSYALYLVQSVAYRIVQRIVPPEQHGLWVAAVNCVATFGLMGVLAELNYRLVETPLRRRGARLAQGLLAGAMQEGKPGVRI